MTVPLNEIEVSAGFMQDLGARCKRCGRELWDSWPEVTVISVGRLVELAEAHVCRQRKDQP